MKLEDLAHEIWSTAQLLPGEGIEDGVARVEELLSMYLDECKKFPRRKLPPCWICGRQLHGNHSVKLTLKADGVQRTMHKSCASAELAANQTQWEKP